MRINKLSLNASNSEYMVIGHRRQLNKIGNDLPDLVLNNEVIKRVDKTKYLGINIDESLNWKERYKAVKNKLKGGMNSLRKLKTSFRKGNLIKYTKLSLKAIFAMATLLGVLFPTPNYPNCNDYRQPQRS